MTVEQIEQVVDDLLEQQVLLRPNSSTQVSFEYIQYLVKVMESIRDKLSRPTRATAYDAYLMSARLHSSLEDLLRMRTQG